MSNWILMTKGEEQKLVHPGNVNNHLRAGWCRVEEHSKEESKVAEPLPVAVETPTAVVKANESTPDESTSNGDDQPLESQADPTFPA